MLAIFSATMAEIEPGKSYKLTKPTFLYQGVLINQNSVVDVKSIDEDGTCTILYLDRENLPHDIPGIRVDDLSALN